MYRPFFGAGLAEELLKIIPVFILMYVGQSPVNSSGHHPASLGVKEPLDGIVLASASGLGFTLVETLTQYVPNLINNVASELGGSADALQAGQLLGIQLLVPRIIGSLAGHMAYSGYFGYFVGLSVLFPQKRGLTLAIGYLTSSLLHALWNASGSTLGPIMLAVAGILSYIFLIAAILKARELSPTRSQILPLSLPHRTSGRLILQLC
ncbi:MAG: PrsW family intramembrane metalloprotease [Acaryochloridaceae cyanobacterium RL_2_7]|nr:PrsW family intramembrane metalloprotease [Acaryochloridaceae cyanobacterium RL_2_7]